MDKDMKREGQINLQMANEDFYRNQAMCYRKSDEYNQMIELYPVLRHTIGACENERLIA